jgi:twitching motility protein PilT
VVSQRLLPKVGGGRVAALEVMGTSLLIKDIVTNGEQPDKTFYGAIESMRPLGYQTFDQHILDLFSEKLINEETARIFSSKKTIISRGIDNLKALAGESVYSLNSLTLEDQDFSEEEQAANAVEEAAAAAHAATNSVQSQPTMGQQPAYGGQLHGQQANAARR